MRKFLGFLICLIISIGILILSLISNSVTCVKNENKCFFNSKINYLNIKLDSYTTELSDIKKISCEKRVQPSKKGKKAFYQLKITLPDGDYNISTYAKYKECRAVEHSIRQDFKNPEINIVKISSASGFINSLGLIFAFIIFIIGIIILRTEETYEEEDTAEENL